MRLQSSLWTATLRRFRLRRNRNVSKRPSIGRVRRLTIEALESRQLLSITVDTLVDENNDLNTGGKSLREALAYSATQPGTQVIEFDPSLRGGTIQLEYGELLISSDVEIRGTGLDLAIDAHRASRVFFVGNVANNVDATIRGLTITGGGNVAQGAGIFSDHANLTLDSVRVTNNWTYLTGHTNGGGVYSYLGSFHMQNSSVDNNQSRYGGGLEIRVDRNDVMQIHSSTIYDNDARNDNNGLGGGIIINSSSGVVPLAIWNSTISGNESNHSGGLRIEGLANLLVANSTVTGNRVLGAGDAHAGGISLLNNSSLEIYNSILAGNSATMGYNDIVKWHNAFCMGSSNLIGDVGNASFGQFTNNTVLGIGVVPGLSPLGNYGGNLLTHVPLPGSPAIDRGIDILFETTDQRGVRRAIDHPDVPNGSDGFVDIGAVEAGLLVTTAADEIKADNKLSLREALQLANGASLSSAPISIGFSSLLAGETIRLASSGQLNIGNSVQLLGPGAELLAIDARGASRVFNIDDGLNTQFKNVEIVGLTIRNGLASSADGGGIYSSENLTLRSVIVTGNKGQAGGGLRNAGGSVAIVDSTFSNNEAQWGGGAFLQSAGDVYPIRITGSTFNDNQARANYLFGSGGGGAIYVGYGGTATKPIDINHTTFVANHADVEGGGAVVQLVDWRRFTGQRHSHRQYGQPRRRRFAQRRPVADRDGQLV